MVVNILNKVVVSDQYLEETNLLVVYFNDHPTQIYDLAQPIPDTIRSIVARDNHLLYIEFVNGEEKYYNMVNRLTGVFSFLSDINEFQKVKLVHEGKAIGWNHQGKLIDLWVDSLYFHSYPIENES